MKNECWGYHRHHVAGRTPQETRGRCGAERCARRSQWMDVIAHSEPAASYNNGLLVAHTL
eukprot:scaffold61437_cov18-Prasinocladus_malaysianus.AAC.1